MPNTVLNMLQRSSVVTKVTLCPLRRNHCISHCRSGSMHCTGTNCSFTCSSRVFSIGVGDRRRHGALNTPLVCTWDECCDCMCLSAAVLASFPDLADVSQQDWRHTADGVRQWKSGSFGNSARICNIIIVYLHTPFARRGE